ncbi:substrate-binding protein [Siccirubricoccus deserti]|uniref:ABC transporter substrate-binding protein n=1 Tax=Siccirubricoccus deserti TaxID=2013562 RepID=A0A9X0UD05_9PROT|nr:ABC transporter substrate-binding protein [Siccirubricoccus deserti]MBC4015822.1 ABC transporter substrate-binding protein [Siccirubricoccus deserti]GGC44909.1 substrate-binding protein [Siccirubricoccus deserti]
MQRRTLLAGATVAALPGIAIGQPAQARVLRMVPQANLTSIDPIWTTANITRNHGFMVYDTLFGLDAQFRPQPQMAAGHLAEEDGRRVTITLREGLKFHDGAPVRAADCAASIQRWMKRNPTGQKLEAVLDAIEAPDDRRLVFRLKRPFPMLVHGLASPTNPVCFIMPERVAKTDPFQQIRDPTGSGPFRFKQDEFNSGSLIVYERNPDYVPVPQGEPSLTAGPKVVHFDRVEWRIITDAATSAAALQQGEIDWFEQPPPEIQQLLRRNRQVVIEPIDPLPLTGILRFNHLHPPFSDKRLRQAILPAVDQSDYMAAVVGTDPAMIRTGVGFFTPGTPMASDVGLGPLTSPRSVDRARALLKEAGYTDQPMRLIGPTDILAPSAMTQVGADMFRRLGMNVDVALSDWGTVVQRRTSREPLEKGGWSVLYTSFSSFEFLDPAGHTPLRGNGTAAWPGWPSIPRIEELRDAWFDAPDVAAQQRICRDIQTVAMEELPYIPVGAYMAMTALRRNLTGRVPGFAIYWGLRRA